MQFNIKLRKEAQKKITLSSECNGESDEKLLQFFNPPLDLKGTFEKEKKWNQRYNNKVKCSIVSELHNSNRK